MGIEIVILNFCEYFLKPFILNITKRLYKLRQGASIKANVCRSVGLSVENFVNEFKIKENQNSLIIFDYLINFSLH